VTVRPARAKAGGRARKDEIERAESGRALCRWCRAETPPRRRTFCSDACVHEWKLRTDPGYLRERVLQRDAGVCAKCGINTISLRRDMRRLDFAARRRFLKEWGLTERSRRAVRSREHAHAVFEMPQRSDSSAARSAQKSYFLKSRSKASRASMAFLGAGELMPGIA